MYVPPSVAYTTPSSARAPPETARLIFAASKCRIALESSSPVYGVSSCVSAGSASTARSTVKPTAADCAPVQLRSAVTTAISQ